MAVQYSPRMPLSEKRLAANRANALKSTGPKTEHGKRMSAQNGSNRARLANVVILTIESRDNFFTLAKSFEDMFQPHDPFEESLVENMIVARWRTILSGTSNPPTSTTPSRASAKPASRKTRPPPPPSPCRTSPMRAARRKDSRATKPVMTAEYHRAVISSHAIARKNDG